MFVRNFGKISIFLAFSSSFAVKNDNFAFFFSLFSLQILSLPGFFSKTKIHGFHENGPILTEKEPIRAHGFA